MRNDPYEVLLADTRESLRDHFRLRYRVYCLETGYENPAQFPNREERDRYDPHAVHFLLRRPQVAESIGALRLVLPVDGSLPVDEHGILSADTRRLIEAGGVAEVSRVCHLRGDGVPGGRSAALPDDPGVLFRLLRAAFFYSLETDIERLLFLIRPAMARMIGRMAIPLERAGDGCDHRGVRYPYIVDLHQAVSDMLREVPALARHLRPSAAYRRHSEMTYHRVAMRLAS